MSAIMAIQQTIYTFSFKNENAITMSINVALRKYMAQVKC